MGKSSRLSVYRTIDVRPLSERMPLDVWGLRGCVEFLLDWPIDIPVCLDVLRVGSRRCWLLFHYSSFRHQIGPI
jgi:hypothetical protein